MIDNVYWNNFYNKIDNKLGATLENNIIIFGSSQSGEFIRWFYSQFYNKSIKAVIDRWEADKHYHVLHLMSFYYLYDKADIIINTCPKELGPINEFKNIGEDWSNVLYSNNQIINLWDELYNIREPESSERYDITFYDYLEYTKKVDLLTTISRSSVKGSNAHGYYPTDFRIIYTIFNLSDHFSKNNYLLDIGCGKGASLIALHECGFKNLGGVEYTEQIYNTLIKNLSSLNIDYKENPVNNKYMPNINTPPPYIRCYLGDATEMELQLDLYDGYFFFNPFSYKLTKIVFDHIIDSLKRKPRKIKIFYAEPICHQLLIDSGYFIVKAQIGDSFGGLTYNANIYESI